MDTTKIPVMADHAICINNVVVLNTRYAHTKTRHMAAKVPETAGK